jgi:CBS-domain-containing membrane protein
VNPSSLTDPLLREVPVLAASDPLAAAVPAVIQSGLPALPVSGEDRSYCGIFGEREFITAVFPGYLGELKHAGFVPRSLESALQKRATCRNEPVRDWMNTEHVDVGNDFSDAQVAEIFLHHRVLLVPVVEHGRIQGVITRSDFFRALAERVLDP